MCEALIYPVLMFIEFIILLCINPHKNAHSLTMISKNRDVSYIIILYIASSTVNTIFLFEVGMFDLKVYPTIFYN